MIKYSLTKEGLKSIISPYKNLFAKKLHQNKLLTKSLTKTNSFSKSLRGKMTEKVSKQTFYQKFDKKSENKIITNTSDFIKNINFKLPKVDLSNLKNKLNFKKLSIQPIISKFNFKKEIKNEKEYLIDVDKKFLKLDGLIKLNSVSKNFGSNSVINNISLAIPKGKILGLVGISGSGKTTLLKMMVGFYKPTKGSVVIEGRDVLKHQKLVRQSIGFGSQENCFYGRLNVEENIKYFGKLYGLTESFIDSRVDDVLKLVGLYNARNTLAENLSTGMKRRLDIACSLIHDPNIVILDEPTEDLDLNLRKEILNVIKKINAEGKTVVMTSHLLGEIEHVCHNVGILVNGKIVKFGSPEELIKEYTTDYEIHLQLSSGNYKNLLKGLKIKKLVNQNNGVKLYVSDYEHTLSKIIQRAKKDKIISLKVGRPSLGEIFQSYTKNAK